MLGALAFCYNATADVVITTLTAKNIQVKAEWEMKGRDAKFFSIDDGVLMMRTDIFVVSDYTAIVELTDKFSMLNPSYKDLVMTASINIAINSSTGKLEKAWKSGEAPGARMTVSNYLQTITLAASQPEFSFTKENRVTIEAIDVPILGTDIFTGEVFRLNEPVKYIAGIDGDGYSISMEDGTKISFEDDGNKVLVHKGTVAINGVEYTDADDEIILPISLTSD